MIRFKNYISKGLIKVPQKILKKFEKSLLQTDPDPKRVFHVSIANKTGKVGDSVATI